MSFSWQRPPPRTAGVGRRAAAFTLDQVLVFLLAWLVVASAAAAGLLRVPDAEFLGVRSWAWSLLALAGVLELPILLAYFTILEASGGRTPGKILLGLRVERVDGGRPTLFESFLRNLLRLLWVTPFGVAFILLDLWSLNATELDQRIGDLATGTIVTEEGSA